MATEQQPVVKKGNASWKPHQSLTVDNKDSGKRYRWVNKDDVNIERKLGEGWTFSEKVGGLQHLRPRTVEAGSGKVGAQIQYRDLVLMETSEETALARADYYRELTDQQTKGLKSRLADRLRSLGPHAVQTPGRIVIE